MFGRYLRGALNVLGAFLVAAFLRFIVPFFLPYLGSEDDLLYRSFASLSEHAFTIMVFAIIAALVAGATVESKARRL